jgi:hypothetical protein
MPEGRAGGRARFGGLRRLHAAGSGGENVLQNGIAAGQELPDQLAGEDQFAAARQGDDDLAVDDLDPGAFEIEGEAEDRAGRKFDFDPLARRRLGNDDRLALLRERRDLGGDLDKLKAERVARGLRSRMSARRGLYSMIGTNGASSLYPGLRRLLPTTVKSKMLQGLGYERIPAERA